jgi:hypothetical protein
MAAQISLGVAINVQSADLYAALHRDFPDSRVDGLAAP